MFEHQDSIAYPVAVGLELAQARLKRFATQYFDDEAKKAVSIARVKAEEAYGDDLPAPFVEMLAEDIAVAACLELRRSGNFISEDTIEEIMRRIWEIITGGAGR